MELINLPFIKQQAIKKEDENINFRIFLKGKDYKKVDEALKPIATKYTSEIDCTQCGNCCKNILISANKEEVAKIATAINMEPAACQAKYFEGSSESNELLMSAIPCHFLTNNKCTIYESRPSACASFPHLNLPHFTSRLFNMLYGYGLCPIIYHTMEDLKKHYSFTY